MKIWGKLVLGLALVATAFIAFAGDTEADRIKKADEINYKLVKIDVYNQILPLILKKDQISKLLPVIEKARKRTKDTQDQELEVMKAMEKKLDVALKEANEKSKVPSRELFKEILDMYKLFRVKRLVTIGENTDTVSEVLNKILDKGQKAALIGALDMKSADGGFDTSKLSDEMKLRFYVQTILLEPAAYDILLEMSKKKDE